MDNVYYSQPDAIIYSHGLESRFDLQPVTRQAYKLVEGMLCDHRGSIGLTTTKEYEEFCALFDYAGLHVQPL